MSISDDISYGTQREIANAPTIANFLGCKLRKLDQFHIMDWVEEQPDDDELMPWLVEQKARKCTYTYAFENFRSPKLRYCSVLIGKHKTDHMKAHGENGLVVFDFTDKIMYWQFNAEQYAKMEVEQQFLRNSRTGYVDKQCPVVHIPCSMLKEMPRLPTFSPIRTDSYDPAN